MKKVLGFLKWFAVTLVGLSILVLLAPFVLSIFFHDIAPIDDASLRDIGHIEIKDEDNAWGLFEKMSALSDEIDDKRVYSRYILGENWVDRYDEEKKEAISQTEVEQILNIPANKQVIEYFLQMKDRKVLQNSFYQDSKNFSYVIMSEHEYPNYGTIRKAVKLNSTRAYLLHQEGNDKRAINLLIDGAKVGSLMRTGKQSDIIQNLVGVAVEDISYTVLEKILKEGINISEEDRVLLVAKLRFKTDWEKSYISTAKIERYMFPANMVDWIQKQHNNYFQSVDQELTWWNKLKSGWYINRYSFHPNRTKAIFAKQAELGIRAIVSGCDASETFDIEYKMDDMLYGQNTPESWIDVMKPNFIGRFLVLNTLAGNGSKARIKNCQTEKKHTEMINLLLDVTQQDEIDIESKM